MGGDKTPRMSYVVLMSSALTQLFCWGYICGSVTVLPVFYQDEYHERKLSGTISSIELAMSLLAGVPTIFLNYKIGERWLQVFGGLLMSGGTAATGFCVEAWQALLCTGIIGGVGAAAVVTASYSIVTKHFPGLSLTPYALMSIFFTVGTMVSPLYINAAMKSIGFQNTMLMCAGILFLNVPLGLLYVPAKGDNTQSSEEGDNAATTSGRHNFSWRTFARRGGVFHVGGSQALVKQTEKLESKESGRLESSGQRAELRKISSLSTIIMKFDQQQSTLDQVSDDLNNNSSSATVGDGDKKSEPRKTHKLSTMSSTASIKSLISVEMGDNFADLVADADLAKKTIKELLRSKDIIIYLLNAALLTFAFVGFQSLLGDYSRFYLKLDNDQFSFGATLHGFAMLPTGVLYLLLTKFVDFSATMFHAVTSILLAICWLMFLFPLSYPMFLFMNVMTGIFRSAVVGNFFSNCLESVGDSSKAVLMFMIEQLGDGIMGCASPYTVAYLQVDLDIKAGIIVCVAVNLIFSILYLPVCWKHLSRPRVYHKHDHTHDCADVKFTSNLSLPH